MASHSLRRTVAWPNFFTMDPAEFQEVYEILPDFLVILPVTLMSIPPLSLAFLYVSAVIICYSEAVSCLQDALKDDLKQKTSASSPDFYF